MASRQWPSDKREKPTMNSEVHISRWHANTENRVSYWWDGKES